MVILPSVVIPITRANPDLIEAIENNDVTKVEQLIKGGVDPDEAIDIEHEVSGRITNVLCLASIYGNAKLVKLLIKHGMNINFEETVEALHVATAYGHLEIVKMLIETIETIETCGANPLSEYTGQPPLHETAWIFRSHPATCSGNIQPPIPLVSGH